MKLIIAEKPSLARTIAKALGKYKSHTEEDRTGYLENDDYIITWAFGHLYTLKDVNDYLGKKTLWKDIPIPFIPSLFEYKVRLNKSKETDEVAKKQIKIIESFLKREDITEVIHCGDSDREGQIIVDILLKLLNNKKDVKRLWLPEQTEETIRKGLKNLKENSSYENLKMEGLTRSYMDWILGINLTIFLSLKAGEKLTVGRVLIPILKFIYDRDMKIKNFKPETYFELQSKGKKDDVDFILTVREKYEDSEKAAEKAKTLNLSKGIVKEIEKTEKRKYPSKLFSLSKLQKFLSEKYKINFESSMKSIQRLYEGGYITYPRTSTEYLAETEKEKIQEILSKIPDIDLEFKDSKKIFDSSKVESHSAITITTKIPDIDSFSEELDKTIYKAIFNRFISNFLKEDTVLSETSVKILVADEEFTLKGETIINEGFLKYEPQKIENKLPNFTLNEEFDVNFEVLEKQTKAPNHATESELESFLENPFRNEKTTEEEEYKAILSGTQIGTTATRTEIVSKAIAYNYFSRKNGSYYLEPLGERIVDVLDKLKVNLYKDRTVEFSIFLKKVNKNEITSEEVIENVKKELLEIFKTDVEIEKKAPPEKESFGKCPVCKKDIYKGNTKSGKVSYYCSGYKDGCTFALYDEMKHFSNVLKISDSKAKKLIEGKEVLFKLKSSKGNEYEAYLKLKMNGKYVNFEQTRFKEKKGGN